MKRWSSSSPRSAAENGSITVVSAHRCDGGQPTTVREGIGRSKRRLLSGGSSETEVQIAGISLIAKRVEGADPSLPDAVDKMKNKLGSGVVVLASVQEDEPP